MRVFSSCASRVFKLCMLMSEQNGVAIPTAVAEMLAQDGMTTCDDYLQFIIRATTDPSPALSGWNNRVDSQTVRYPLCFSLKYMLAKVAMVNEPIIQINEIIGAYHHSGFTGGESDEDFNALLVDRSAYAEIASSLKARQARESIKFMSQLSFTHCKRSSILMSLGRDDAHRMFQIITPVTGVHKLDGNAEIQRLSAYFVQEQNQELNHYGKYQLHDSPENGFSEGTKVVRTHIAVERNSSLRDTFFKKNPTATCDACELDTHAKYPWSKRILDIHHILPLSSGPRVGSNGTLLDDLVPVCPTCHRAVHRFYDNHLRRKGRKDFSSREEAHDLYARARQAIIKGVANAS